jgi:hypothetical protein
MISVPRIVCMAAEEPMSEQNVVVATYIHAYEAELARNLLESQGITVFLNGGAMGLVPLLDTFRIEVDADDAARASAILAEVSLEKDWEEKAESGAGVWTCSVCGEPVAESMDMCFACSTPRDAIRTEVPPSLVQLPREALRADGIQSEHQPASHEAQVPSSDIAADQREETPGDGADRLAQQAFSASLLAWLVGLLMPLAWWRLLQAYESFEALGRRGRGYFYGAVAINAFVLLFYTLIGFLVLSHGWLWR